MAMVPKCSLTMGTRPKDEGFRCSDPFVPLLVLV